MITPHEFQPGSKAKVGSDGRRWSLCSECGLTRRNKPHQPVKARKPAPVPAPPPEPRELTMLRLAADAALERPDLGWTLRQRLVAVRQAVDLPPDERPERVVVDGAPPERTTRASHRGASRWVRRALGGGPMWDIAAAALDQGYEAQRTGNGHVRFAKGIQAFSLSTTVRDSEAHSLKNARAAARRAGVVV